MERGKEGKRERGKAGREGKTEGRRKTKGREDERTGRRKDGKTEGTGRRKDGETERRKNGRTEGKMESGERTEGLREMMKGLANGRIGRRSRRRLSGDRGCRFVLLLY
jgi:hypothetical protein